MENTWLRLKGVLTTNDCIEKKRVEDKKNAKQKVRDDFETYMEESSVLKSLREEAKKAHVRDHPDQPFQQVKITKF